MNLFLLFGLLSVGDGERTFQCPAEGCTVDASTKDFLKNHDTLLGDVRIAGNNADIELVFASLTKITGSLIIDGNADVLTLNSLSGMRALETIGLDLRIQHVSSLSTLDGLWSLVSIGRSIVLQDLTALSSIAALEKLTQIPDSLTIVRCGLNSLLGLNAVEKVKSLTLEDTQLNDVDGLESLTNVSLNLDIKGNGRLQHLWGLRHLRSIAANLTVQDNSELASLDGLRYVTEVGPSVAVRNLAALQSLRLCGLLSHWKDTPGQLLIENVPLLPCSSTTDIFDNPQLPLKVDVTFLCTSSVDTSYGCGFLVYEDLAIPAGSTGAVTPARATPLAATDCIFVDIPPNGVALSDEGVISIGVSAPRGFALTTLGIWCTGHQGYANVALQRDALVYGPGIYTTYAQEKSLAPLQDVVAKGCFFPAGPPGISVTPTGVIYVSQRAPPLQRTSLVVDCAGHLGSVWVTVDKLSLNYSSPSMIVAMGKSATLDAQSSMLPTQCHLEMPPPHSLPFLTVEPQGRVVVLDATPPGRHTLVIQCVYHSSELLLHVAKLPLSYDNLSVAWPYLGEAIVRVPTKLEASDGAELSGCAIDASLGPPRPEGIIVSDAGVIWANSSNLPSTLGVAPLLLTVSCLLHEGHISVLVSKAGLLYTELFVTLEDSLISSQPIVEAGKPAIDGLCSLMPNSTANITVNENTGVVSVVGDVVRDVNLTVMCVNHVGDVQVRVFKELLTYATTWAVLRGPMQAVHPSPMETEPKGCVILGAQPVGVSVSSLTAVIYIYQAPDSLRTVLQVDCARHRGTVTLNIGKFDLGYPPLFEVPFGAVMATDPDLTQTDVATDCHFLLPPPTGVMIDTYGTVYVVAEEALALTELSVQCTDHQGFIRVSVSRKKEFWLRYLETTVHYGRAETIEAIWNGPDPTACSISNDVPEGIGCSSRGTVTVAGGTLHANVSTILQITCREHEGSVSLFFEKGVLLYHSTVVALGVATKIAATNSEPRTGCIWAEEGVPTGINLLDTGTVVFSKAVGAMTTQGFGVECDLHRGVVVFTVMEGDSRLMASENMTILIVGLGLASLVMLLCLVFVLCAVVVRKRTRYQQELNQALAGDDQLAEPQLNPVTPDQHQSSIAEPSGAISVPGSPAFFSSNYEDSSPQI